MLPKMNPNWYHRTKIFYCPRCINSAVNPDARDIERGHWKLWKPISPFLVPTALQQAQVEAVSSGDLLFDRKIWKPECLSAHDLIYQVMG